MWLFALIIGWPLIEIALFVTIGGWIGLWPTLAVVVGSALVGVAILRGQGLRNLAQVRSSVSVMQIGAEQIARTVLVVIAAVLLVLPGFLTDALGLVLLVPPVQTLVLSSAKLRLQAFASRFPDTRGGPAGRARPNDPTRPGLVIDGEFEEIDPPIRPTHTPSGWTRH